MPAAINTFRNVRARLSRPGDTEWLSGWVTHLAREEARIRICNFNVLSGQEVVCECYGQGTIARFSGKVFAQADMDLAIELSGSISYAPSQETPRIYAAGLVGQVEGPDGGGTITVLDVSPLSLGVLSDVAFGPMTELAVDLPTEMGPIAATVTVANCRPDPESPGFFRIGLNIVDMARLDRARWGRLVIERSEA